MAKSGSKKIGGSTVQQKMFALEYFSNGGNATLAAIAAGYAKKSAHVTGSRLLNYAKVQLQIQKLTKDLEDKALITKERILEEYVKIGLFDLRTLYTDKNALKNIKDLDAVAGAAISGIKVLEVFEGTGEDRVHIGNTVEIKLNSKQAALDAIRDTMGWKAPTKIAGTNPDGTPIDAPKIVMTDDQLLELKRSIESKK